jgi:hypothetical protein
MLGRILSMIGQLVDAGGSVVGYRHGTQEPSHSVEKLTRGVEIRRYGNRIAAETTVVADEESARNVGFRRLAGYIFGANHEHAKIAMTAPVAQEFGGSHDHEMAGCGTRLPAKRLTADRLRLAVQKAVTMAEVPARGRRF